MTNPNFARILALRGTLTYTPRPSRSVNTETSHLPVRTSLSNDIYAKRS